MNLYDSGMFSIPDFKNRSIIKSAPDVLVYIGGSPVEKYIAPVSGGEQTMSFNDGITSVSVQNNIDPPGSSTATIQITTPIYGDQSNYWITKRENNRLYRYPIFVPMMEVKIYFKGRFLVNNETKYYPAFWGFITGIEENYSGGSYSMSLNCADVLHWWEYLTINMHPTIRDSIVGGQTSTVYKSIFNASGPYDIIWRLASNMGMDQMVVPTWAGQLTPFSQSYPPAQLRLAQQHMMKYWDSRLSNMASLLKMYGALGKQVLFGKNGKVIKQSPPLKVIAETETNSKSKQGSVADTEKWGVDTAFFNNTYIADFTVFFDFDAMGDFDQSEYLTKLEVATEVKNRCDFEFFQDVNGNFIFKPPFYNMNTSRTLPYVIKSHDIISNSFQTDIEGIVTALEINTPFAEQLRSMGSYPAGIGFHIDLDLAAKYGVRYKKVGLEYIKSPKAANQLALGFMSFINAKCFTGSVTIPGRPELRLGYPIYIDHRDSFHYVRSINHSFDYGSTFSTSLSLEAERGKMSKEIILPELNSEGPMIDYIYKYTAALDAETDKLANPNEYQKKLQEMWASQGRVTSMKQGRYELVPRDTKVEALKAVTPSSAPFSDEGGYRLIGAFPYGRGKPLVDTNDDPNDERNWVETDPVMDIVAGYQAESYEMGKLNAKTMMKNPFSTPDPNSTVNTIETLIKTEQALLAYAGDFNKISTGDDVGTSDEEISSSTDAAAHIGLSQEKTDEIVKERLNAAILMGDAVRSAVSTVNTANQPLPKSKPAVATDNKATKVNSPTSNFLISPNTELTSV